MDCHLAVVEGLVCFYDPENSAGGGIASGRYNQAGKINGEKPDKRAVTKLYSVVIYEQELIHCVPYNGCQWTNITVSYHFIIVIY